MIASRTDEDLLDHLRPVAERFEKMLERAGLGASPGPMSREERTSFRRLVVAFMQGLAVMRIVDDGEDYVEDVLGTLKDLCRRSLASRRREGS